VLNRLPFAPQRRDGRREDGSRTEVAEFEDCRFSPLLEEGRRRRPLPSGFLAPPRLGVLALKVSLEPETPVLALPSPAKALMRLARALLPAGRALTRLGEPVMRSGPAVMRSGKPVMLAGDGLIRLGQALICLGIPVIRLGRPVIWLGEPLIRPGEALIWFGRALIWGLSAFSDGFYVVSADSGQNPGRRWAKRDSWTTSRRSWDALKG
jgi:hypothetical protein